MSKEEKIQKLADFLNDEVLPILVEHKEDLDRLHLEAVMINHNDIEKRILKELEETAKEDKEKVIELMKKEYKVKINDDYKVADNTYKELAYEGLPVSVFSKPDTELEEVLEDLIYAKVEYFSTLVKESKK